MGVVVFKPLRRVDWFALLAELKRSGVSSREVARRLTVEHSTVLRWGEGTEPRHADGEVLIGLWCERTGRARAEIPLCKWCGNAT